MMARRIKILHAFGHLQLGKVTVAAFLLVAVGLLTLQMGGHAQTTNPLPYSGGYLVTGNYVVGGVDLTEELNPSDPVTGLSTGTINISTVPTDATIVAAYLYWETITLQADPSQAKAKFRGYDLPLDDEGAVRRIPLDLTGSAATCWSSGTPLTMHHFKADVLRYFDVRLDQDNNETGKRIVNGAHEIQLPTRSGNQVPESAGATLVIVYVDPSEPLRKIVFYDGRYRQPDLTTPMVQTLQGFYKSALTNKSAKLTHIVASGQPNNKDRIFFNDGPTTGQPGYDATNGYQQATDPVFGGTSSQRGWSQNTVLDPSLYRDVTYDVSNFMNPGNNSSGGYGETATTTLDHTQGGSYDCLVWGAIIFSTAVDDDEANQDSGPLGDGLPDGLEEAENGLSDPDGEPLPNLYQMGARSGQRDLFVEINAMRTLVAKNHGSTSAPYSGFGTSPATVSVPPHTHMPTPEVLKKIGDAYLAHGIHAHFDVGNIQAYKNHGNFYDTLDGNLVADGVISHADWVDDYDSTAADAYLVSWEPTGGEVLDEHKCIFGLPDEEGLPQGFEPIIENCQFEAFPGAVGWKLGLQLIRDWPVGANGEELITTAQLDAWKDGLDHRHRFDRKRFGLFHYLLYAHYRGLARSEFPCLTQNNTPAGTNNNGVCGGPLKDNPDFYVPSSSGGFADRPGGNAMVTMGRWDEYVGKPFSRASTSFHELGHNLNLSHGGILPILGNQNTSTIVEPNCKPNYLSSMSYLFQVHGLLDDNDNLHLDYSSTQHDDIGESGTLGDAAINPLSAALYRPAWYAPYPSALATLLGVSNATRFCNGLKFPTQNAPSMARVYVAFYNDPIDWNGDQDSNSSTSQQDVNFDSGVTALMSGFNDWQNIRLNQIMSGRKVGRVIGESSDWSGDGSDWLGDGSDWTGDGSDWLGDGSDWLGDGSDWLGDGSDWTGDGSDWLGDGSDWSGDGSVPFELDFDGAKGLGRSAPSALQVCIVGVLPDCVAASPVNPNHARHLTWSPSTFAKALYNVSRKLGDALSTYPFVAPQPTSTSTSATFNDTEQLPDTQACISAQQPQVVPCVFTYRMNAEFDDQTPHAFSPYSKSVTTDIVNVAPQANPESYVATRNRALRVGDPQNPSAPAPKGVLLNDTDADSPLSFLRAVLVSQAAHGTVALNSNGSFTYEPAGGYTGPDSFTYKANNGIWIGSPAGTPIPLSADSNTVTVSISVNPPK